MANWLSRATSLFKQSPPPVQTFEVECDCGAKVTGERSSNYQKPNCPACSCPVFVLPHNVYPQPKSVSKSKPDKDSAASRLAKSDPRAVVKGVPATVPPKPGSVRAGKPTKPAEPVEERLSRQQMESELTYRRFFRRPKLTPLRTVALAILCMSALTVTGLMYRHRIENAKAIVSKAADAGYAALKDRDFELASKEFNRARDAVNILHRTDSSANEMRQQSRETTAIANLAASTLTEIVEESLGKKASAMQTTILSSAIKGTWAIFDVRFHPESKGNANYRIDSPLFVDEVAATIEISAQVFKEIPWANEQGEPSRVIFAAQFDRMSPPSGDPKTSVLTLDGKTAFLWADYDNYLSVGYRPADEENERETKALLQRQSEIQQARK